MARKKLTQKDVWGGICRTHGIWKRAKVKISDITFVDNAIEVLERDNSIKVPIEWKQKFRNRFRKTRCGDKKPNMSY